MILSNKSVVTRLCAVGFPLVAFGVPAVAVGCSNDSPAASTAPVDTAPIPSSTATTDPTTEPTNPGPEKRKLTVGPGFPTSTTNLLVDPNFAIQSDGFSAGAFVTYDERSGDTLKLDVSSDSRSPAGSSGKIATIEPNGATNTSTRGVIVLTSFLGGAGPFDAKIWVSKSDIDGNPVDINLDTKKGIFASVADGSPNGEAFDLTAVEGAAKVIGGRTWTLLRGNVPRALTYGGYFVVHTGTGGGFYSIAAPEVVAASLGTNATSLGVTKVATAARSLSPEERAAIGRYRSLPPRLAPPPGSVLRKP